MDKVMDNPAWRTGGPRPPGIMAWRGAWTGGLKKDLQVETTVPCNKRNADLKVKVG